jgi:hypothetical protein
MLPPFVLVDVLGVLSPVRYFIGEQRLVLGFCFPAQ